jgi:hypothetical protein
MDRDELRALQAPLKERYRERPDAALVTLSAVGKIGEIDERAWVLRRLSSAVRWTQSGAGAGAERGGWLSRLQR